MATTENSTAHISINLNVALLAFPDNIYSGNTAKRITMKATNSGGDGMGPISKKTAIHN
jgi:hypothetical protein